MDCYIVSIYFNGVTTNLQIAGVCDNLELAIMLAKNRVPGCTITETVDNIYVIKLNNNYRGWIEGKDIIIYEEDII